MSYRYIDRPGPSSPQVPGTGTRIARGWRAAWVALAGLFLPVALSALVPRLRDAGAGHAGPLTAWGLGAAAAGTALLLVGPVLVLVAAVRVSRAERWIATGPCGLPGGPADEAGSVAARRVLDSQRAAVRDVAGAGTAFALLSVLTTVGGVVRDLHRPVMTWIGAGASAGIAVLVGGGAWLWFRRRHAVLERIEPHVPPVPVPVCPAPPAEAPPAAGGRGRRGPDPLWWIGAAVAVAALLVVLLVPPDGVLPGAEAASARTPSAAPSWFLAVECLIVAGLVVVTAAYLRTPPGISHWPDPLTRLDHANRRLLGRALRGKAPLPEALRPFARAHLARVVHHRRRAPFAVAFLLLLMLLMNVHELARRADGHLGAALTVTLGLLALVATPVDLRTRRRAAHRLAALDHRRAS